jgi:hypothetical protein
MFPTDFDVHKEYYDISVPGKSESPTHIPSKNLKTSKGVRVVGSPQMMRNTQQFPSCVKKLDQPMPKFAVVR